MNSLGMPHSRGDPRNRSLPQINSDELYQGTEGRDANANTSPHYTIETQRLDEKKSDGNEIGEKIDASAKSEASSQGNEMIDENTMDGTPYDRDVEAPPPIEKKKSETPAKDPNLVSTIQGHLNRLWLLKNRAR